MHDYYSECSGDSRSCPTSSLSTLVAELTDSTPVPTVCGTSQRLRALSPSPSFPLPPPTALGVPPALRSPSLGDSASPYSSLPAGSHRRLSAAARMAMVPLNPSLGQLPSSRRGLANGPALGWRAPAGARAGDDPRAPGPKEKEKEAEDAHPSASLQAAAPRGAALSSATPRGALRHLAALSGAAEEVPALMVTAMSQELSTGRERPKPGTCLGGRRPP